MVATELHIEITVIQAEIWEFSQLSKKNTCLPLFLAQNNFVCNFSAKKQKKSSKKCVLKNILVKEIHARQARFHRHRPDISRIFIFVDEFQNDLIRPKKPILKIKK